MTFKCRTSKKRTNPVYPNRFFTHIVKPVEQNYLPKFLGRHTLFRNEWFTVISYSFSLDCFSFVNVSWGGLSEHYVSFKFMCTCDWIKLEILGKYFVCITRIHDLVLSLPGECSQTVCERIKCHNGGTCMPDSPDTHVCLCPLGTAGDRCENSKITILLHDFMALKFNVGIKISMIL